MAHKWPLLRNNEKNSKNVNSKHVKTAKNKNDLD
jgi:hypothetical protein